MGVTGRRVLYALTGLWLLRWAAGEVAAYAGRHWREHGPPPIESERAPGWMPPPRRVSSTTETSPPIAGRDMSRRDLSK